MYWRRLVLVADSVHFQERCHFGGVSKIIREGSTRCGWDGFRFACHEIRIQFPLELVAEKWVGKACAVRASTDTSRYYIWLNVDRLELFLRLKANDRLISQNMIHDRAYTVSPVIVSYGVFERFAY